MQSLPGRLGRLKFRFFHNHAKVRALWHTLLNFDACDVACRYQLTCSWAFKDGTSADEIENLLKSTRALQDAVPGVISLTIGENIHELSKGLTHGMAIVYESKEAMDAWGPHAKHQEVLNQVWVPVVDMETLQAQAWVMEDR